MVEPIAKMSENPHHCHCFIVYLRCSIKPFTTRTMPNAEKIAHPASFAAKCLHKMVAKRIVLVNCSGALLFHIVQDPMLVYKVLKVLRTIRVINTGAYISSFKTQLLGL
jgi:hypothetical protein